MKIDLAVLNRQYELHAAEYDAAALRALRSGWYIMGPDSRRRSPPIRGQTMPLD